MKLLVYFTIFAIVATAAAWDHVIGTTKADETLIYTKGQTRSIPKPKTLVIKFAYNGSTKVNEITHVDLKIREVNFVIFAHLDASQFNVSLIEKKCS